MASTNVRIDPRTHAALCELSEQQHRPIGQVVSDAVEKYREDIFWQEMHEDFARLRADPEAWQDYQDEMVLWDTTSGVGLENEKPYYYQSGQPVDDPADRRSVGHGQVDGCEGDCQAA